MVRNTPHFALPSSTPLVSFTRCQLFMTCTNDGGALSSATQHCVEEKARGERHVLFPARSTGCHERHLFFFFHSRRRTTQQPRNTCTVKVLRRAPSNKLLHSNHQLQCTQTVKSIAEVCKYRSVIVTQALVWCLSSWYISNLCMKLGNLPCIYAFYNVFIRSCIFFFFLRPLFSYLFLHCNGTILSCRSHYSLFTRIVTCSQCALINLYVFTTTSVVYTAHVCNAAVAWLRPQPRQAVCLQIFSWGGLQHCTSCLF